MNSKKIGPIAFSEKIWSSNRGWSPVVDPSSRMPRRFNSAVGSPWFGKHLAIELSSENQKQLFIPRGFAHGYACLSQMALLSYKVDSYYNKAAEQSIAFNDPQLAIDWQIPHQLQKLSPKDLQHPTFEAAQHFDYNQPFYD